MKTVVIHPINGTTKTAEFEGPIVTWTAPADGIIFVDILGDDRSQLGSAAFTGGMVALRGVAIEQYKPMTQAPKPT